MWTKKSFQLLFVIGIFVIVSAVQAMEIDGQRAKISYSALHEYSRDTIINHSKLECQVERALSPSYFLALAERSIERIMEKEKAERRMLMDAVQPTKESWWQRTTNWISDELDKGFKQGIL